MMELDDELVWACHQTLEDAREIIEDWEIQIMAERPESLFLLNSAQCIEMWQSFKRVYDAFEPSSSYRRDFRRKCLHVFADFYNIVELGDMVMEMCSDPESWLKAAILYGNNKSMFQELSENLQVCVDCARELTKSFTFSTHKPLKHVKVALLPDKAEENFKKDTTSLKAKLQDLVNRSGSENNEIHLAEYLVDRQNFMPTSDSNSGAQSSCHAVSDSQNLTPSDAESSKKFFDSNRHYPTKGDDCEGDVRCTVDWLVLNCFKKNFNTKGYDQENLPKFLEKFQKEVSALQRLNHHNIVKFLCSRGMPKPSILMESVEMNLREFLNKRNKVPINLVGAVDMMLQMGLGIKYMHEEKVVHRDLKPQNIGVSPSLHPCLEKLGYVEVKLIDLGDAKMNVTDADQPTYKPIGTKPYIAPEAEDTRESNPIDWRLADTYSFAMTCSEILTFQRPPRGRERPELPRECPDYLREFLKKCWAKNPKSRPYFQEIVSTLKKFKRHLLLGTVPECAPSVDGFMKCLIRSKVKYWIQNSRTKDISTLRVDGRELEQIMVSDAYIERRLKLVGSVVESMNERRRHVIICPTQCSHLVEECENGVKQVTLAYHNLNPKMMVDLFRSMDKKLQGLAHSLDVLITSLMAAEELVGSCSGPHPWKVMAVALCAPSPFRLTCSRFGYCLWELYWSLYVTRSHLDATYSHEVGPLLLTSLSFKWSSESCKFVLVAKPIVNGAGDLEIENLETEGEEQFIKANEERRIQDCKLLLSRLRNSTLEEPLVNHWHVIGMYLESLCASIWKVPTTKFDNNSLPPKLGAMLMRRLESRESLESKHEPRSQTSVVAFYDFNDQKLDCNSEIPILSSAWRVWYDCWVWGVKMLLLETPFQRCKTLKVIKLLARVQHPNIVNLIGCQGEFQSDGEEAEEWPCMSIFEPMKTCLDDLIESNMAFYSGSSPFSFRVTLDILLQIVEAMIHMHQCGVVHLDLDPWNILVEPKNTIDRFGTADLDLHLYYNVKLAGFEDGILVNLNGPVGSKVSFDGIHAGISRYMAPELCGRGQYTKFVDVWSFGMTAYHIVSGSRPFGSMYIPDIWRYLKLVKQGETQLLIPFGATFPKGLKALIQKCCVGDPYARISFEEIRKELWTLRKKFDIDGLQE